MNQTHARNESEQKVLVYLVHVCEDCTLLDKQGKSWVSQVLEQTLSFLGPAWRCHRCERIPSEGFSGAHATSWKLTSLRFVY